MSMTEKGHFACFRLAFFPSWSWLKYDPEKPELPTNPFLHAEINAKVSGKKLCSVPVGADETQVFSRFFFNNFTFPQFIIPAAFNNQKLFLHGYEKIVVLWNQDHSQLLHCIPKGTGSLRLGKAKPWKSRLCTCHLLSNWDYLGWGVGNIYQTQII